MPRRPARILAAVLLALTAAAAPAAPDGPQVWLIGGGPTPQSNGLQIEHNLRDARRRLAPLAAGLDIWFADGPDPRPDLVYEDLDHPGYRRLLPLARVQGVWLENRYRYRNHALAEVAAVADLAGVRDGVGAALTALRPGQRGLLVFLGHGLLDDQAGSQIALWGAQRLGVAGFTRLLDRAPDGARVRYLLGQCHAGGFARAMYRGGGSDLASVDGSRCGFMAVAEERLAEGCAAGLLPGEDRDYIGDLLAALGAPGQPAGVTGLFAAHLTALRRSRASDQPRSTSEQLLLDWAPAPADAAPPMQADNPYHALAAALQVDLGLQGDDDREAALGQRQRALAGRQARLARDLASTWSAIQARREPLAQALAQRYPGVTHPDTAAYAVFLDSELDAYSVALQGHPGYAGLVRLQDRYEQLERELTALRREHARGARLAQVQRLARRLDALAVQGSPALRQAYRRLRACESLPP